MERLTKVRARLQELGVDAMMITNPMSRRYLSGFTGSNGVILITENEARLITDYRYFQQARMQTEGFEVVLHAGHTGHKGLIFDEVANQVKEMGITRLGFEQDQLTFTFYKKCEEVFAAELIPVSGLVEKLRAIKSAEEIELLKTAAQIADAAFLHVLEVVRAGVSELDVAFALENYMKKQGTDTTGFSPIVASGYRGALAHGRASDKIMEKGDLVTIDFGCNYKGYWSDISRTVAIGDPSEQLREIHAVVLESFNRCVSGLRPGLTDQEVDSLMRDVIKAHGYNELSGTGTGHGIGLEVHEDPFFSVRQVMSLAPGMVITVEPGIYLPNVGGARVEDVILITEQGSEVFTPSTKEMLIL